MKIGVYYHAYLDDYFMWSHIFLEQFKCMEDSGLSKNINRMKITAITQNDQRVQMFHEFCSLYKIPIEIQFVQNQYKNDHDMMRDFVQIFHHNTSKNVDERFTHQKMYEDCQVEDQYVLYLHSKGMSSLINNLMVPGRVSKFRNRYYWRQFMNNAISRWEDCVEGLKEHDISGIDFSNSPSPHFRGNFFWTKSEHVRKLPSPTTGEWFVELKKRLNNDWLNSVNDRFGTELWIGSLPETKSYNVISNNGNYIENDI